MYLLLYTLIIYGINFLYFLSYYYLNFFYFSKYNIIFTSLFSLFLTWLITFSSKKIWKLLSIIIVSILTIINIINFIYYKYFGVFFNPFKYLHFGKQSNISFFADYLTEIPASIYLINIIWGTVLILLIIFYKPLFLKFKELPFLHKIHYNNEKKYKKYYFLYTIILTIILIFSHIIYFQNIENNYNEKWWDNSIKDQDFTSWGLITENIINKIIHANTPTSLAISEKISNTKQNSNKEISVLTDNEKLYEDINDLHKLNRKYSYSNSHFQKIDNIKIDHIIMLQLESVPSWVIDQMSSENTAMPFLQKLKNENYSVKNFNANSCCTINAEFTTLCSFYPNSTGAIAESNLHNQNYNCLPDILKKHNFKTALYHANNYAFWQRHQLYPNWGMDTADIHLSPEFPIRDSDLNVLDKLANDLKLADEKNEKTFSYFISFTSHGPHNENYLYNYNERNKNLDDIPLFNKKIPSNIQNAIELKDPKLLNSYLSLLSAVDQSLEYFFQKLEKYDLLKNSLIFIYGDHRFYQMKPTTDLNNFYAYNNIPFIMILDQHKAKKALDIASHIDIAPSILDLLNIQKPNYFLGESLFSENYSNSAINKCFGQFYYIDQNIIIQGNDKNKIYKKFYSKKDNIDENKYIPLLKNISSLSDTILDKDEILNIRK